MSSDAELRFIVAADDVGRVDRAVARHFPDVGRRRLSELFAAGAVRVGGRVARKGDRVDVGAEVVLAQAPLSRADLPPTPDPAVAARLVVLYRDDDVVAIDKPPGVPSQPLRAGELGTAANGIIALHPECADVADDPRDGGLVHRLDIGTSGVLVAARNRDAWEALRAAFGSGAVDKEYVALTFGAPVATECDAPLAQRGKKVVVDLADGLPAHTRWKVERAIGPWRLVRCQATTGRMHQVRAHLAHCGAPIAGDVLYGGPPVDGLIGFFLHAAVVRFPGRSGQITVEAPLPVDRREVLAQVGG